MQNLPETAPEECGVAWVVRCLLFSLLSEVLKMPAVKNKVFVWDYSSNDNLKKHHNLKLFSIKAISDDCSCTQLLLLLISKMCVVEAE